MYMYSLSGSCFFHAFSDGLRMVRKTYIKPKHLRHDIVGFMGIAPRLEVCNLGLV